MALEVVVLAAGMGTRMNSAVPKVLHKIGGRPMLQRVLDVAAELAPVKIHLIIGAGADQVRAAFRHGPAATALNWVMQTKPQGTGHAVLQALPHFTPGNRVLVLYGDVPLVTEASLRKLIDAVATTNLGLMTAVMDAPAALGRILRDADKRVLGIRELRDASPAEAAINEINTGIMLAPVDCLARWLPKLSPDNAQRELYLTDVVAMAVADGVAINTTSPGHIDETGGINDRAQLAGAERIWQQRIAEQLMRDGATLLDPARIDVRGELTTGRDCVIDVNVVFEGVVTLGENVRIGAHCYLRNAVLGDNCIVAPNTFIDGAQLGAAVEVGPFARLRPGTVLADEVHIGNFVETKKARLGRGSKANHLAYLGDTNIGAGCNIGAGTITCNYDGINKHQTDIGDNVFVGSNSTLVAPITLESDSFIAAGSTVTHTVPAKSLAVGRGKQRNIEGWTRPDQRRT